MSDAGKFWNNVKKTSLNNNEKPVMIGRITSINPIGISFQGLNLSKSQGDNIYLNGLLTDEQIQFDTALPITCSTGTISENHTDIINAITQWLMSVHGRFIIHIGDYVALQKLGNNTYLILEKVENEQ